MMRYILIGKSFTISRLLVNSTVYTSNMSGKVASITKTFSTLRTDMGLLSFVHTPHVLYEMHFLRKVFTTVSTGVWFLALVYALDVAVKITLLSE